MSRPEIVSETFEPTVAWLDEALGNDWSFRVVSYEVRDSGALVLGELAHAGRVRQQFGRSCDRRDLDEDGEAAGRLSHLRRDRPGNP
jgi:hypothetical protein